MTDETIWPGGVCRCCSDRSLLYSLAVCSDVDPPRTCTECGQPCRNIGCNHVKQFTSPIQALEAVFGFLINHGAPETRIVWRVDGYDGVYGARFAADGPVEVCLTGSEQAVDPERQAGRELYFANGQLWRKIAGPTVIPFVFETYVQADVAGDVLAAALKTVNKVRDTWPCDGDDCAEFGHIVKLERFSRHLNMRAVCERCMVVLKDEVDPLDYLAIEAASGVTVAKLIEREVNR